jgi:hypothetical protein
MHTRAFHRSLVVLGLACAFLGPAPGVACEAQGDGATPRQLMQRAVEQALAAEGLAIESGSVRSGQLVTAWTPLEASALGGLVRPGGTRPDAAWEGAEYRLAIRLSIAPDGWMTSEVRAQILAWPPVVASPDRQRPAGVTLLSNSTLEQRFMRAVSAEVDRIAHLFPSESDDGGAAEPYTGSTGREP